MLSRARWYAAVYSPQWTLAHPVKIALNPILGFIARGYRCGFDASGSTMSAAVRRDAYLASVLIQPDSNDPAAV